MNKPSLVVWYLRRLRNAFLFAMPTIFACILLGLLGNDNLIIIGITLIMFLNGLVMFTKKTLPWPLSIWQKMWNNIPTWQDYI